MKKQLLTLLIIPLLLTGCNDTNKPSSDESKTDNVGEEVTKQTFDNAFKQDYFTKKTDDLSVETVENNNKVIKTTARFDNGNIYYKVSQDEEVINEYYYKFNDDNSTSLLYKVNDDWIKQSINFYGSYINNALSLGLFNFNFDEFNYSDGTYHKDSASFTVNVANGSNNYVLSDINLKFIDNKLVSYSYYKIVECVVFANGSPDNKFVDSTPIYFSASIDYEKVTIALPEAIDKKDVSFKNVVIKCTDVETEHPDIESIKKTYIDSYIQLFDDETFEFVIYEDSSFIQAFTGTFRADDFYAILTVNELHNGENIFDMGEMKLSLYNSSVDDDYYLGIMLDDYGTFLTFVMTEETPVKHEFPEPPEQNPYEIDSTKWSNILSGSLLHYTMNYTCKMQKTDPTTGVVYEQCTFYFDKGNIKTSVPASYDPTISVDEYYALIEYGNPSSKYLHYSQNGSETWYTEDLNSSYTIFYLFNLGIIIDLSFDELTFNDNTYTCSHKKSFPYEQAPSSYRIYDDIELTFENGNPKQIVYKCNGYLYIFQYSDYGTTVVNIPNI